MSKVSSRRWCFTVNNYTDEDFVTISSWDSKYLVFGKEVAPTTLTPHLQGFVIFKKVLFLTGVKKLHATAHWETAKGTSSQASDYCKKDGDFTEVGILSQQGKRTDLDNAITDLKDGVPMADIAENHSAVFVKFGRGLRDLALTLSKPYNHDRVRGIWIWGPPGTGKSHWARTLSGSIYLKAQNKWFDGYNGEDVILLDDLDSNVLGHHLKIWADKYACTGETKGGTTPLQHSRFVVTSNYSIEQLWDQDPVMAAAINRRFSVFEKTSKNQILDYLN